MTTGIRLILIAFFALLLIPGMPCAGGGDGSVVKITSPHNGEVVGSTVDVKYELKKGTHGDHVHAYVDGQYQKGFKGTLHGLKKGTHEISIKVANTDHDVLDASHTVTVEVK